MNDEALFMHPHIWSQLPDTIISSHILCFLPWWTALDVAKAHSLSFYRATLAPHKEKIIWTRVIQAFVRTHVFSKAVVCITSPCFEICIHEGGRELSQGRLQSETRWQVIQAWEDFLYPALHSCPERVHITTSEADTYCEKLQTSLRWYGCDVKMCVS